MEIGNEQLVVYLLMRDDLASLNPGKACAQAHHAGTLIANHSKTWSPEHHEWYTIWEDEGNGFGTVLCLGANERAILQALDIAKRLDVPHGIVRDPGYPLRDGRVTHSIPLETCAYIFGPKVLIQNATAGLDLHP